MTGFTRFSRAADRPSAKVAKVANVVEWPGDAGSSYRKFRSFRYAAACCRPERKPEDSRLSQVSQGPAFPVADLDEAALIDAYAERIAICTATASARPRFMQRPTQRSVRR